MEKAKVFIFQQNIPHYRLGIFKLINKREKILLIKGNENNKLHLIESNNNIEDIDVFKVRVIKFFKGKLIWYPFLDVFKKYHKPKLIIFEANTRIISIFFLQVICKILGIKFVLWGHGGSMKRNINDSGLSNYIGRMFINKADGYICYTESVRDKIKGLNPNLYIARNTLDSEILIPIRNNLFKKDRKNLKASHDLHAKYYICFIGRLIKEKRVDVILNSISEIQKDFECGGIIIGDGPEKETLEYIVEENEIRNIKFFGNIADWTKSSTLLYCSDVFLNPGYVGLSINHSFCFGIPVITQKANHFEYPYHSPEVQYLVNGKTGFLAEDVKDPNEIKELFKLIINNKNYYRQQTIEYFNQFLLIEHMVKGFDEAFEQNL